MIKLHKLKLNISTHFISPILSVSNLDEIVVFEKMERFALNNEIINGVNGYSDNLTQIYFLKELTQPTIYRTLNQTT